MPLWIVSSAGSGIAIHWNQPPSSSRFTRRPPALACDLGTSMMIVECGMPSRSARMTPVCACPWSSDCRPVSTRSNFSSGHGAASASATTKASAAAERVVFDVQRAIGAARQRLANDLLHARRAGRADDDLATVLLAKPQRLLERVGVRLVHLVADVLLADPGLVVAQPRLPFAGGDLLDADGDLHERVAARSDRTHGGQRSRTTNPGP